jgi:hypothetical protein
MPGGQIRSGIFNRRAASAISGVESSAKARDSESVFTLRRCSYSASFAKIESWRMTKEERSRLEELDAVLRSGNVREQIRPVVERVRTELARQTEALMSWKPIPLSVFGRGLPPGIRSAWVFILRAGEDTGAERHPNSHQRMMSFEGGGDLQTGEPGRWQSNILISDPAAPLEQRWISIPPNVWHRPVVGRDADWAVVSFHTVEAHELIEEKPDTSSKSGTKQMKYLATKVRSKS